MLYGYNGCSIFFDLYIKWWIGGPYEVKPHFMIYIYIKRERERNHKQYTKIEKTPIFGYIKILVMISINIYISIWICKCSVCNK
jgi:hypothetical protein